jgi:hypothetical protein
MSPSGMLIFLPVRDGGAYLTEAIDSIRAQTNPDWRLVVLENGSADDTVRRAERYGDARIIVRPAIESLDIRANWQRSILYLQQEVAVDPLITFIGHDDRLAPTFVETILALARTHPAATLYQTHFDLIDASGALIRRSRPIAERESADDLAAMLCWGLRDSYGTGYSCRASDYLRVGGWPNFARLLYSDHLLFLRLTALGYKAASPVSGCEYRLHAGSTSGSLGRGSLVAYLVALESFVAALDAEMPAFTASERGRDALGHLLARSVAPYRLLFARRRLDGKGRAALARLDERLDALDRGQSRLLSSQLYGGRLSKLRYVNASARFLLATRKP